MAVVTGAAEVPDARIAGVALTVHGDQALPAMSKTLQLYGGKRVLLKQEGGRACKSNNPPFHAFLMLVNGCDLII